MTADLLIVAFALAIVLYGLFKRVNCFEAFVSGVREGTATVVNMFSYLLAFVLLVSLLENCGIVRDVVKLFGSRDFSPLVLVQVLFRPFSAASSYALMLEVYRNEGPDSFSSLLSTFIHGISDASVFIIVFYCGAAGIKKYNKALLYGLLLNLIGFLLAFLFTWLLA